MDEDETLDYGGEPLRPGDEQEDAVSLGSAADDDDDAPAAYAPPRPRSPSPGSRPSVPGTPQDSQPLSPRNPHADTDMDRGLHRDSEPGAYPDSPRKHAADAPLTHALPSKPTFYARAADPSAPAMSRPRERAERDYDRPPRRYNDEPRPPRQDYRDRRARSPPSSDSPPPDRRGPPPPSSRPQQQQHQAPRDDYRTSAPDDRERDRPSAHDDRRFIPGPGFERPARGRSFSPPRRPRDWDARARDDYADTAAPRPSQNQSQTHSLSHTHSSHVRAPSARAAAGRDYRDTNRAADWPADSRRAHPSAAADDPQYSYPRGPEAAPAYRDPKAHPAPPPKWSAPERTFVCPPRARALHPSPASAARALVRVLIRSSSPRAVLACSRSPPASCL
jgi:hypothetical protein